MRKSLMKRIKSFEKECILHVLGDCALYIVPLKKQKTKKYENCFSLCARSCSLLGGDAAVTSDTNKKESAKIVNS